MKDVFLAEKNWRRNEIHFHLKHNTFYFLNQTIVTLNCTFFHLKAATLLKGR